MRGKAAAQAANRRAAAASQRITELEAELRDSKTAHRDEVQALRVELTRTQQEIMRRAADLAAEEIARLRAAEEEERRQKGLSDDIVLNFALRQDRLIMNACRYLSMTRGLGPLHVLPAVLTWLTDKRFVGYTAKPMDLVTELGVHPRGWTARMLSQVNQHHERDVTRRNRRKGTADAYPLDEVEQRLGDFTQVHPKYRPQWYPRVRHGGIELTDDGDWGGESEDSAQAGTATLG